MTRSNDMAELLNVIDKTDLVSFLQDNSTNTFIVVSTMHTIKGSYNVERVELGVVFEHSTQCKGHSKGFHLPI